MTPSGESLERQWARLGVLFDVPPAAQTADLEALLLETARAAPAGARLFGAAVSWLSVYGQLVAKHRLKGLLLEGIDARTSAVMGLMLEFGRPPTGPDHFNVPLGACRPVSPPGPLFDVDRAGEALARLARQRSGPEGRRWGLWCEPVRPRAEIIRPGGWLLAKNPSLRYRALFCGDLRASILACLLHDFPPGASQADLVRRCAASRKAVREALDRLALAGLIRRQRLGRCCRILPADLRRTAVAG